MLAHPGPPAVSAGARCAVVAFAPSGIVEDMRKVRAWCPRSGRPVMDCHVGLVEQFDAPEDLAGLRGALARAVAGGPAFTVRTVEPAVVARAGRADVVLPLEESPQLAELQARVASTLAPWLGQPAAARPTVPVVEDVSPEGAEAALRVLAGWRVNYSWVVRDVDLVGLTPGLPWRSLGPLNFGRL